MDKLKGLQFAGLVFGIAVAVALATIVLSYLENRLRAVAIYFSLSPKDGIIVIAFLGVVLALLVLLTPVYRYVTKTQNSRRDAIRSYYTPGNIAEYFQQFCYGLEGIREMLVGWKPGNNVTSEKAQALRTRFDKLLSEEYFVNQRFYFAVVLLSIIAIPVLFFAIEGGLALAKGASTTDRNLEILGIYLDPISIAAVFGAYTWIVTDAIERNYQGTLNPSHLYWYAVRLVVAVPLGQAIAAFATGALGPAIAFLVSMFSYERISTITSSLVNRSLSIPAATPDAKNDIVSKLPGVDETTSSLFQTEGITTISELTSADPVRISVRTGLAFDQLICLIDAAILWRYVETDLMILRKFGWAGASNVIWYQETFGAYNAARAKATDLKNEVNDLQAAVQNAKQDEAKAKLEETKSKSKILEDTLAETIKKHREATLRVSDEEQRLPSQSSKMLTLLNDMEEAVKSTKVSGLLNIANQVCHDSYAQFIRRLMTAQPHSPDN